MYGPMDAALMLRDKTDGAEGATATEAPICVDMVAAGDFRVVFHVSALDRTDGNETYVLSVEVAGLADFSDGITIGTLPPIGVVGVYELPLSGEMVRQHHPSAAYARCKATLGGTTPSLIYGCYLAPTR